MTKELKPTTLTEFLKKIRAFSPRETLLAGTACAFVIYGGTYVAYLQPLEKKQSQIDSDFIEKKRLLADAKALLNTPSDKSDDPNAQKRAQMNTLLDRLRVVETTLSQNIARLTKDANASHIVERALANYPRIHFDKFENQPPELILKKDDALSKGLGDAVRALLPDREIVLYRHTMRAEVRGPYLDLVAYLRQLERSSDQLFLGEVQLHTLTYPESMLSIELVTLSPNRALFSANTP